MMIADPATQTDFRVAMRRLASTVAVVTAACEGERYGMTMTAVTSLSMDPPALVLCVNRSASIHAVLSRGHLVPFCINLLGEAQHAIAQAFAGQSPREERFATGAWIHEADGTPVLADAQSSLCCRVHSAHSLFSHTMFVGLVESARFQDAARPLIYGDGCFGRLATG